MSRLPSLRRRLSHAPTLHSPAHGHERRVGWLELFYDLVYVATFIQLGNALARDATVHGFVGFCGLMIPVWLAWTGFTFFTNRFVVDDVLHRVMVMAQMLAIGAMAATIPRVFVGDGAAFAWNFGLVRLVLVALYLRTHLQLPTARPVTRRFGLGFLIGAALWFGSAFVPEPLRYVLWGLAVLVDLVTPLGRSARTLVASHPPDAAHISERYGLLMLIVLGESFVKVVTALADTAAAGTSPDVRAMVLMGTLALAITASLWWLYFDDIAGSRVKRSPGLAITWVYTHLPLAIGLTGLGVGLKKAVLLPPDMAAPLAYRWLLCGSLGLAFVATAVLCAVTERRHADVADRARVVVRLASGGLVFLLAPAGAGLPAWGLLALLAFICAAQVAFDLSMAPLADANHGSDDAPAFGSPAPAPAVVTTVTGPPVRDTRDAIRIGTPTDFRSDLYYHLMAGGWVRLLVTIGGAFLFLNVVFAALYSLEPESIANARADSFADHFYFSVQTIATIGYGGMSPATTYSNLLVTVESAIGILFTALATGLMFAKASRPSASVLFSEHAVITNYSGRRVLMFRLGNARGNEIVEATINVSCMRDVVTPEGHRMREITDLRLRRNRQPLFALSWLVLHEIDEASPFFGCTAATGVSEEMAGIVVTMTGHDATYAQTTHARTFYRRHQIRPDHHFKDIISTSDDGRTIIDYSKLHDTEPDLPLVS